MLVLSRKPGEEIMIGENIRIVINKVGPNRVSLGIEAPPEVRITRGELETFSEPPRKSQPAAPRRVCMPREPRPGVQTAPTRPLSGALSLPR